MAESFGGITVPEGDPGELRGSAQRLGAAAAALHDVSREVGGMPSGLGSWQGPASGNYAASCLSLSGAASRMADGRTRAAAAITGFADDLQEAREEARAAIEEARDAKRRIERAQEQLAAARERMKDALERASAARGELSAAAGAGSPRPDAQAALDQAEADADEAEREIRMWTDRLEEAREDLERAQRRGEKAETLAETAARRTRSAVGEIDAGAPQWVPPSFPALQELPGSAPAKPWYEQAGGWLLGAGEDAVEWTGDQATQVPGGVENGINGFGAMLAHGYSGSPFARTFDGDSYDPMADPSINPAAGPLGQIAQDPVGSAKSIVNWEDFSQGRVGEGVGELLPGLLAGGAGGAALRTTRAVPDAPTTGRPTPVPARPDPASPTAGAAPPNLVVRAPDGALLFRTGPDGELVRPNELPPLASHQELKNELPDPREQRLKEESLADRARPGEQLRHGTPPPNVKTKKEAAAELLRLFGEGIEDLGG